MLIGGLIAYGIENYTYRSKTFFRTAFFLPVVTSVAVIAIVWEQMYAPYYGILHEFLKNLGLPIESSLLADADTTIFALIIVNIWQWTGFSMLMYIVGLNNIPAEIYDAAKIDGASGLNLALFVLIPMLGPVTKSLLLLGIIGTLQTFPVVYLMTTGGPDHASEVFGTYIFKQAFVLGQTGYAATLSVAVLVIALALTIVQIVWLGSQLAPTTVRGEPR
jgi:ABC-type sugar transport system permease subunit